jgi:hypothetical protein
MISIEIPVGGNPEVENGFRLNGTLAEDGALIPGVKEKIEPFRKRRKSILTADIHGSAERFFRK